MADIQVTCIRKFSRYNPYEGITHLGNSKDKWTREQVIHWIENKTNTFFTLVDGKRAHIVVVDGPNGKYLRTSADSQWNDDLLALPECP